MVCRYQHRQSLIMAIQKAFGFVGAVYSNSCQACNYQSGCGFCSQNSVCYPGDQYGSNSSSAPSACRYNGPSWKYFASECTSQTNCLLYANFPPFYLSTNRLLHTHTHRKMHTYKLCFSLDSYVRSY